MSFLDPLPGYFRAARPEAPAVSRRYHIDDLLVFTLHLDEPITLFTTVHVPGTARNVSWSVA